MQLNKIEVHETSKTWAWSYKRSATGPGAAWEANRGTPLQALPIACLIVPEVSHRESVMSGSTRISSALTMSATRLHAPKTVRLSF